MAEKVLVVDDDPASAEFLVMYLRDNHFDVLARNSFNAACVALTEFNPEILITDFELGDGTGLALATIFKQKGGRLAIEISGYARIAEISAEKERVVFDKVLLKPLDLFELLANIRMFHEVK